LVFVAPIGVAVLLSSLAAFLVLIGRGRRGPDPSDLVEPA